jgi:hypothetical protein
VLDAKKSGDAIELFSCRDRIVQDEACNGDIQLEQRNVIIRRRVPVRGMGVEMYVEVIGSST